MPAQGKKQQKDSNRTQKKPPPVAKPGPRAVNHAEVVQKNASQGDTKAKAKPVKATVSDEVKVQVEQLLKDECEHKDIVEEFICGICLVHVVGCGPKLTTCSHLFCGDCMEQWFASHQTNQTWAQRAHKAGEERKAPCPVCKFELVESESLYSVSPSGTAESFMLWQMLSSLKVACANHPTIQPATGKCRWTGEYGDYQVHMCKCKNDPDQDFTVVVPAEEPVPEPVVVSEPKPEVVPPRDQTAWDDIDTTSATQQSDKIVAEVVVPDAWDDDDEADTSAPVSKAAETVAPARCDTPSTELVDTSSSEHGKEVSGFSANGSSEALVAIDEPCATESTVASEAQQAPAQQAATAQQARKEAQAPVQPAKKEECAAPKTEKEETMRDLMASIGQLVQLSITESRTEPRRVVDQCALSPPPEEEDEEVIELTVMHPFSATSETQLELVKGHIVEVLEQHSSGWTFGRKCDGPACGNAVSEGWFPHWAVCP